MSDGPALGPGERYLLKSMELRNDMRIHALLGNLYDRLGRQDEAMRHWRLASSVAGVLPVLPRDAHLPAADLRGDPTLIDVEVPMDDAPAISDSTVVAPIAASAADYVVEDTRVGETKSRPDAPDSKEVKFAKSDTSSFDEYFDTAPIPGVDVTQTSDGPRRRN